MLVARRRARWRFALLLVTSLKIHITAFQAATLETRAALLVAALGRVKIRTVALRATAVGLRTATFLATVMKLSTAVFLITALELSTAAFLSTALRWG